MKKYNKEKLIEIVDKSLSYADVCRKMGLVSYGGNYKTIKKYIKLYDIDINHFTGKGWNQGVNFKPFNKKIELKDILVENSTYNNSTHLKERLYNSGLKEKKCEICKRENEWEGKELILHLDHINGINNDNRIENLRILCPNCHSQTNTYCTKKIKKEKIKKEKIKKEKKKYFCGCGEEIHRNSKMCDKCSKYKLRKVKNRPTKDELLLELSTSNYTAVGKKYGVSDNAIRKWLKTS